MIKIGLSRDWVHDCIPSGKLKMLKRDVSGSTARMLSFGIRTIFTLFLVVVTIGVSTQCLGQPVAVPLTAEQRQAFDASLRQLKASLASHQMPIEINLPDAAIFAKGLDWALKYDREFSAGDVGLLRKAASRGLERAKAIQKQTASWQSHRGKLALGYISKVDQSVQPYGLIVPKSYDQSQPIRLDVVLHGSTRPVGLSELRFMARFDEGDGENAAPPDQPFIELHPLGRVENCYRWAGETDVFEAIEDVCRRYQIDRDRIVLRGMSMGASGTWHLGLKHPDRFVALGPYCGYVDTHRFSETPLPNFVKVGPLPEHQELGLHMLDSVDYAANAGVVPAIACIGEKDIFFEAHVIMGKAFEREGLKMVNLISPGTGHVIDPVTHAEQMRRIAGYVDQGRNQKPAEIRFVTWTLKYSRCHWLQVLGLKHHYSRAEFSGKLRGDVLEIAEPTNITRFAILTSQLPELPRIIRVGQTELSLTDLSLTKWPEVVIAKTDDHWQIEMARSSSANQAVKRPGLQGPIDDAFAAPFLCVRGTGAAWNPAVQIYADASLERFAEEWRHYFRGELPVKNDTEVTDEDLRTRNLILFGDPGSNLWIARTLPQLPFTWSKSTLRLAGNEYNSTTHVPALISPNPLPGANDRYIVINSGHTFREAELAKLNYLLFPRWGDWAVLQIDAQPGPNTPLTEKVIQAGYFDEQWKLP